VGRGREEEEEEEEEGGSSAAVRTARMRSTSAAVGVNSVMETEGGRD
jgi:hypothetical protein